MEKKFIKIDFGEESSSLNFEGDITTLEILFSISMLFDTLEPSQRKFILDKLKPAIFKDLKSGKIIKEPGQ